MSNNTMNDDIQALSKRLRLLKTYQCVYGGPIIKPKVSDKHLKELGVLIVKFQRLEMNIQKLIKFLGIFKAKNEYDVLEDKNFNSLISIFDTQKDILDPELVKLVKIITIINRLRNDFIHGKYSKDTLFRKRKNQYIQETLSLNKIEGLTEQVDRLDSIVQNYFLESSKYSYFFSKMNSKIKNRKQQNISIHLELTDHAKGIAVVSHGLGGFKTQPSIRAFCEACIMAGYSVISFDATNSRGESDGNYQDATLTNYYEDLEDVITWAKSQTWFKNNLILCGHSLGGITSILYTENHLNDVSGLIPISTVVSGKLSFEAHNEKDPNDLPTWKKEGIKHSHSQSRPGEIKSLKWSHMEDRLKYDVLQNIGVINIPTLLIVGEKDDITPVKHQELLFNALSCNKQLSIIKDAPHTFKAPEHLLEIKSIIINWIHTLDNISAK